jgi:hypothetical protein
MSETEYAPAVGKFPDAEKITPFILFVDIV